MLTVKKRISALLVVLLVSAAPVKAMCASSTENGVTASLPDTAKTGEKVELTLDSSHTLPAGGFWRVDITWLERPEGKAPEVLSGVPQSDLRFFVPGRYRCSVESGIVVKGSCAGVTYDKLSTHSFDIEVLP